MVWSYTVCFIMDRWALVQCYKRTPTLRICCVSGPFVSCIIFWLDFFVNSSGIEYLNPLRCSEEVSFTDSVQAQSRCRKGKSSARVPSDEKIGKIQFFSLVSWEHDRKLQKLSSLRLIFFFCVTQTCPPNETRKHVCTEKGRDETGWKHMSVPS